MMDLDNLLADIDGIGTDRFVPSAPNPAEAPHPAATAEPAAMPTVDATPLADDAFLTVAQMLGGTPAPVHPQFGSLDMVIDLELEVLVELGEARLPLRELMRIRPGDQLPLQQRPSDLVKIFVNDRLVAHGEPLVVDGGLAVKVVDFLTDCPEN